VPDAVPAPLGVAEIAWARVGTLARYDFLEADKMIVPEIERLAVIGAF
jgi:8-oxo-dGTP diphosphatase